MLPEFPSPPTPHRFDNCHCARPTKNSDEQRRRLVRAIKFQRERMSDGKVELFPFLVASGANTREQKKAPGAACRGFSEGSR
jgi:hypothetical protein